MQDVACVYPCLQVLLLQQPVVPVSFQPSHVYQDYLGASCAVVKVGHSCPVVLFALQSGAGELLSCRSAVPHVALFIGQAAWCDLGFPAHRIWAYWDMSHKALVAVRCAFAPDCPATLLGWAIMIHTATAGVEHGSHNLATPFDPSLLFIHCEQACQCTDTCAAPCRAVHITLLSSCCKAAGMFLQVFRRISAAARYEHLFCKCLW